MFASDGSQASDNDSALALERTKVEMNDRLVLYFYI
jgi:hypothetical protein